MSTTVWTNELELNSVANKALKVATQFWFVVTVIGQLALGLTVAAFYGLTAMRGNYRAWDSHFTHGFATGDHIGNLAIVMHVFSAMIIMLAGAVQLVPQVRNRFPVFHRWNGRIYMLTAVTLSAAGLYLTWRGSVGDITVHLGSTVNAILIWVCGGMALRYALARDFRTHRLWALRFFLVVSASWFFRIGFFLSALIFQRPFGFDPQTFSGPFLTFMSFAQFLVPLAVLEIYLWAQNHPGTLRRLATAGLLFGVTLMMAAGLFAVTMAVWVPQVKAGLDPRKSIIEPLSAAILSSGVDAAIKKYGDLKATAPATYNFDEDELNNLGYELLRAKKYPEAIRILQLNVEVYPKSSNVYDSLGEAYADEGNKALAIANYHRSVELNPKNVGGIKMLQKLGAQ